MPCRGPSPEEEWALYRREARDEIDKLTRLLCNATTMLEDNGHLKGQSIEARELRLWKVAHDKADKQRKAQEKKATKAEKTAQEVADKLNAALADLDPTLRANIKRKLK